MRRIYVMTMMQNPAAGCLQGNYSGRVAGCQEGLEKDFCFFESGAAGNYLLDGVFDGAGMGRLLRCSGNLITGLGRGFCRPTGIHRIGALEGRRARECDNPAESKARGGFPAVLSQRVSMMSATPSTCRTNEVR